MDPKTRIPAWRTLVNWAAVVILGSILAPIMLSLLAMERLDPEFIPLFMLVSAICSLPALAVFLVTNWRLNLEKLAAGTYRRRQGLIHLGASVLTFVVLWVLYAQDGDPELAEFLLVIGATYTGLGQLAWWLTFFSHSNTEGRKTPPEDLLDDAG